MKHLTILIVIMLLTLSAPNVLAQYDSYGSSWDTNYSSPVWVPSTTSTTSSTSSTSTTATSPTTSSTSTTTSPTTSSSSGSITNAHGIIGLTVPKGAIGVEIWPSESVYCLNNKNIKVYTAHGIAFTKRIHDCLNTTTAVCVEKRDIGEITITNAHSYLLYGYLYPSKMFGGEIGTHASCYPSGFQSLETSATSSTPTTPPQNSTTSSTSTTTGGLEDPAGRETDASTTTTDTYPTSAPLDTSTCVIINAGDTCPTPGSTATTSAAITSNPNEVPTGRYEVEKKDPVLASRVAGRILLQADAKGEAWYVTPDTQKRYYMKDGPVAYQMMRSFGLGITDTDLAKIPSKSDTGAMKTAASVCAGNELANRVKGKIILQVQQKGEAWYVHPDNCHRIYMKDGNAAYEIMRFLSLGISDNDIAKVPSEAL